MCIDRTFFIQIGFKGLYKRLAKFYTASWQASVQQFQYNIVFTSIKSVLFDI